jgi:sterol desaturase/sphingolipid hydroxylase (fatty acid hydroxylase superfamily)
LRLALEGTVPLPSPFRLVLSLGVLAAFMFLEWRRPLRTARESKFTHTLRNLATAVSSAAVIALVETPIVWPLARLVEQERWGLLQLFSLPRWLEMSLALLLMDYTLYIWHILTHRVPLLWRFHAVHHVDLDVDASTALRFHFGEMALSVIWRAGQVIILGISSGALLVWQTALSISILFHHSNLRLPIGIERMLNTFIVTPRMHGIHHSVLDQEVNSNWSSGLTIWDRLHGTLNLAVPQQEVTIGVPAFRDPNQVTLPKIIVLPFIRGADLNPSLMRRSPSVSKGPRTLTRLEE